MAILNYASQLNDSIKSYIGKTDSDRLKLIFTGDKHIITHGIDFLSDYKNGVRGLVPNYDLGTSFGVLSKNGWLSLSTDLSTADNTTLPSTKAVTDYISTYVGNQIVANNLMTFKGVIKISSNKFWHQKVGDNSFTEGLPLSGKIGDYYRIWVEDTAINIVERTPQSGDSILCIQDYTVNSSADANNKNYWLFLDTNVKGTTTLNVGGTEVKVLSDSSKTVNIYTPNSKGSDGQILVSAGTDLPVWKTVSVSADNGRFILQIGDKKYEDDITAASLHNTLTFGTGLVTGTFNGTTNATINLAKATTTSLGGVKIDDGTTNHGNPQVAIPTISVDTNGMIYLTQQNIVNALGYKPTDPSGLITYSAGTGINISNQTISLLKSTTTSIGGIVASNVLTTAVSLTSSNGSTANRYYGVQIDKDGKAFVNVPWTDSNKREIQVGGDSIGDMTLNFVATPGGSIGIVANRNDQDSTNGDVFDIGFDIYWYNLNTLSYET